MVAEARASQGQGIGAAETLLLNAYVAVQAALPARMDTAEVGTRVLQQQTWSHVSYHCQFERAPKKVLITAEGKTQKP